MSPSTATETVGTLVANHTASRLWRRDVTLFSPAGAPEALRAAIRDRLGWLDAPDRIAGDAGTLQAFAAEVEADGLDDVYLLGMGGSSLCAEVLRDLLASAGDRQGARLTVVDTTDERTITGIAERLDPQRALFLVASKSGSTIEVTSLERYFWQVLTEARVEAGRHFVAITDPGTTLAALAETRRYRRTFINPPDIGGRYSALSRFGLVPAALLGIDLAALGASARAMADACREDAPGNPGLALGAFMSGESLRGRDKLTLVISSSLRALGPWIEQLVAESTGKQGTGVLPVVDEPPGGVDVYGADRAFVVIRDAGDSRPGWVERLEHAGHPVFDIETSAAQLGAEFFRWEVATAVAGTALGVNPFDEPNVKEAKARTKAQLDTFLSTGALRMEPPLETRDGARVRVHQRSGEPPPHAFVAILDYLPVDSDREREMDTLRASLRDRTHLATTHGRGPRYLHSTGQYHKGGPDRGRFILVTSDDKTVTLVPESGYSFSVLKHAQALGDFDALAAAGREVLHVHFEDPSSDRVVATLTEIAHAWLAS